MARLVRLRSTADHAAAALWALGATAVVEETDGFTAGFADDDTAIRAAEVLRSDYDVELFTAADPDDRWRDHLRPVHTSRLTVVPPGWAGEVSGAAITIDPGPAFGHGAHPSTLLLLEALDNRVRVGARVLDFGAGTGVLALAALALGRSRATAVDVDDAARATTSANAQRNEAADRLDVLETPPEATTFDLVCANVTIDVHETVGRDLLLALAPDATLLVSGILESQVERAQRAYAPLVESARQRRDGWVALELTRPNGR